MNRWLDYIIILLVNWTTYLTSFSFYFWIWVFVSFSNCFSTMSTLVLLLNRMWVTFVSYMRPTKMVCDYNKFTEIYTNTRLVLHFQQIEDSSKQYAANFYILVILTAVISTWWNLPTFYTPIKVIRRSKMDISQWNFNGKRHNFFKITGWMTRENVGQQQISIVPKNLVLNQHLMYYKVEGGRLLRVT